MIGNYLELARPKTLFLSLSPIFASLAYAYFLEKFPSWDLILAVIICPVFLQIVANAWNDVKDFEGGVDSAKRLGPERMASSKKMSILQIKTFSWVMVFFALIPGIYTIYVRGIIPLILGLVCILGAFAYTSGKKPVSSTPFGEVYVIFFFGLVATIGSYYVFTGEHDFTLYPIAFSLGCLAANVLLLNNYRDLDTDKQAGRKTLMILMGRKIGVAIYKALFMTAHFFTLWGMSFHFQYPYFFVPFVALPLFISTANKLEKNPIDATLNPFLGKTVLLQFIHALLIALSYFLEHFTIKYL